MTVGPITNAAHATADWLVAALADGGLRLPERAISNLRAEPLGMGRGNLGSVQRILLEHDVPDLPRSLVLKFAPSNSSPLLRTWRFGRREALFYSTFGGKGPLRTPRCYHGSFDDRTGNFTLLLEDLSAATSADQEIGASRIQAEIAIEQLAHFHAHFWEDEALGHNASWLSLPNANREAFSFFVKRAWQGCAQRYPELPTSTPQVIAELDRVYGHCLDRVSTGPITLLHGDYRLENMFFESSDWRSPFAVADWQLVCRGRGPWDVADFVVGSLTPETRAVVGPDLVRRYHDIVEKVAKGGYSLEDCFADYDASLIGSFTLAAVLVDAQWRAGGSPVSVIETWLRRAALGAIEALATM